MKKSIKIIILVIVIIALIVAAIMLMQKNSKPKTNLAPINSAEDLTALIDKVYEGMAMPLASLATQTIDISDDAAVQSITGLENASNLEYVVASEPMITSQAYSFVLAKVKDGVNADEVAKTMNEKVDARKWICVTAEKVYTTSSGNVVCLVMSRDDLAKPVYEKFKTLAGNVGQEYEKINQDAELPPEM